MLSIALQFSIQDVGTVDQQEYRIQNGLPPWLLCSANFEAWLTRPPHSFPGQYSHNWNFTEKLTRDRDKRMESTKITHQTDGRVTPPQALTS